MIGAVESASSSRPAKGPWESVSGVGIYSIASPIGSGEANVAGSLSSWLPLTGSSTSLVVVGISSSVESARSWAIGTAATPFSPSIGSSAGPSAISWVGSAGGSGPPASLSFGSIAGPAQAGTSAVSGLSDRITIMSRSAFSGVKGSSLKTSVRCSRAGPVVVTGRTSLVGGATLTFGCGDGPGALASGRGDGPGVRSSACGEGAAGLTSGRGLGFGALTAFTLPATGLPQPIQDLKVGLLLATQLGHEMDHAVPHWPQELATDGFGKPHALKNDSALCVIFASRDPGQVAWGP